METITSILNHQHQRLVEYDYFLSSKKLTLDEVGKLSGEIFHYSDENFHYRYLNPKGCKWFGLPKEEIVVMGNRFLKEFYHPDTLRLEFPKIRNHYNRNSQGSIFSNYQQIFNPGKKAYSICLVFIKKLKSACGFIALTLPLENYLTLTKKERRIMTEELFRSNHKEEFMQLTNRESQILRLLATGMNNPQISDELHISRCTVEQHRKNINRKLHIHGLKDILDYAYAFDLV